MGQSGPAVVAPWSTDKYHSYVDDASGAKGGNRKATTAATCATPVPGGGAAATARGPEQMIINKYLS